MRNALLGDIEGIRITCTKPETVPPENSTIPFLFLFPFLNV